MSKLAMYIVGLATVPCLITRFFLPAIPGVFASSSSPLLASVGSLSLPLHLQTDSSTFQALFSKGKRIHDAYHFDITDVSALAL